MAKKQGIKKAIVKLRSNQLTIQAVEDPQAQKAIETINDVLIDLLEDST